MLFTKGRYRVRFAETGADLAEVLELRRAAFRGGAADDADRFDAMCQHVRVETEDGQLVCCVRLLSLADGVEISRSYSAQFYGLEGLAHFDGPMVEMGRFCIRPGERDADIVRAVWAAVTRLVDARGVELLFGCTSFEGIDAGRYAEAFALLRDQHLAPRRWRPAAKAPSVVWFARRVCGAGADPRRALRAIPPLLRSYLAMGGWVSDHAVVDRELNTIHVFTALEISAIPSGRARLLRADAA